MQSSFNHNVGDWNVSSVTIMSNMFNNADNFDQDIGDWNVSSVTNMESMFASSAISDMNKGKSTVILF